MLTAERPALIFLNGIGDHFINLPAVRAIASIYPDHLTLLCRKGGACAFADAAAGRIVELDCGDDRRDLSLLSDIAGHALAGCDLLVSLNPWHTAIVDTLLARIRPRRSVGFFPVFDVPLPLDFSKHSAELAFDIPRALGSVATLLSCSYPLQLPTWARDSARRILRRLPPSAPVLTVHSDTIAEKMWDAARLNSSLSSFLSDNPSVFALVVGSREADLTGFAAEDRVVSCVGLPFWTSVALVGGSDLFIGMDSCMLHVADMFRVPGIGVFGPTDPREFGFRMSRHRHVTSPGGLSCISEEQVLAALRSLWAEARQLDVRRIRANPARWPAY